MRQQDGREEEIRLPEVKIRLCDDLTRELSQIVGPWGSVFA